MWESVTVFDDSLWCQRHKTHGSLRAWPPPTVWGSRASKPFTFPTWGCTYSLQEIFAPDLPDTSIGTKEAFTCLSTGWRINFSRKQHKLNRRHCHPPQFLDVDQPYIYWDLRQISPHSSVPPLCMLYKLLSGYPQDVTAFVSYLSVPSHSTLSPSRTETCNASLSHVINRTRVNV